MSFQSKYTGQQVEAAIGKAMTAIQPNDLSKVAKSGSYDDLKNKPIIPSAVTEQTVADWGFTKNKGDYVKPQNGIPKSDLDSDVQASLEKANTALQEHQSLKGYATESYVISAIEHAITLTLNTEV